MHMKANTLTRPHLQRGLTLFEYVRFRRWVWVGAALVLSTSGGVLAQVPSGALALYCFGAAGTNDLSGNGRNAVLKGNATLSGGLLQFGAGGGHLEIPGLCSSLNGSGPYTLYLKNLTTTQNNVPLYSVGQDGKQNVVTAFFNGANLSVDWWYSAGWNLNTTTNFRDGTPHEFFTAFSSGGWGVYSATNQVGSGSHTYTVPCGTNSLWIGETVSPSEKADYGWPSARSNGTIAAVAVYARVLSPAEQFALMNSICVTTPTVQFASASSSGLGTVSPALLSVVMSPAATQAVAVAYAATGGTAINGMDYMLAASPLIFNPGETNKVISLTIVNDGWDENDETVVVTLQSVMGVTVCPTVRVAGSGSAAVLISWPEAFASFQLQSRADLTHPPGWANVTNAVVSSNSFCQVTLAYPDQACYFRLSGPGGGGGSVNVVLGVQTNHTYTILDPRPSVGFAAASNSGLQTVSPALIPVTLSRTSAVAVTANYAATGGTAMNGVDYTLSPGTLTFAAGETNKTISVSIINHTNAQLSRTIILGLSDLVGAKPGLTNHTYTIGRDCPPLATFTNPLLDPGADPYVTYAGDQYIGMVTWGDAVFIWRAPKLQELFTQTATNPTQVWGPDFGGIPGGVTGGECPWAPEIWFLDGKWYIYTAAENGDDNATHRMFVLEGGSDPSNPLNGTWTLKAKIFDGTDQWAIDGTILEYNGNRYFVWSGWEGATDGQQNLYIAPMSNPWTISGPRVLLSQPDYAWEEQGLPINEGPEALYKNGTIHIIYAASGSWTTNYCLGQLTFTGGDILSKSSWVKKSTPVFSGSEGPGHSSLTQSPDGTEDWLVYCALRFPDGHTVRAQKFNWNGTNPVFGTPVATGTPITEPSNCTP